MSAVIEGTARSAEVGPPRGVTVLLPGQTPEGHHVLSVLLKRSYDIRPGVPCTRADEDEPLLAGDEHWDTPQNSTVRLESEFVPWKLQTDVVVVGRAHAPGGLPVEQFTTAIHVGTAQEQVTVIGHRRAYFTSETTAPTFSDPEPIATLDLRYEHAYGGVDVYSEPDAPYPYPLNPLGRGFVIRNVQSAVGAVELPNFEDPRDLLTPDRLCVGHYGDWSRQPVPRGYGWCPKNAQPRSLKAGVMPADRELAQRMQTTFAAGLKGAARDFYLKHGLPQIDFDYFNGASSGLRLPFGSLHPGAAVKTLNLSPEGLLEFMLPTDQPLIGIDIGRGPESPQTVLQTVQLRLEERQVDLVWRAAVPYPGPTWLPEMKRLHIEVAEPPGRQA